MDPVPFLSSDWLDATDEAVSALPALTTKAISIEFLVLDGPQGATRHHFTLGPDRIRAHLPSSAPTMTFTLTWDLAVALNQGDGSALAAILDGRIRIDGDPDALLDHKRPRVKLQDVLGPLRAATATRP